MKNDYITILITSNDHGKRIDTLICEKLKNYSRNRLQSMILSNNCMLNGKIVKRPSLKLKEDGTIKLFIPKPVKPEIIATKIKNKYSI